MPPVAVTDFKNLHILIVDDDTATLGVIEGLLNTLDVGLVSRALSGAEAFTVLAKPVRVVDIVLCDYTMANGNGLQLLQAVRMGQIKLVRPDTCFILLTASGDAATVSVAAQLDVSGYVVKPATPDKLRAAIVKARTRAIKINFNKYAQVAVPD